MLVLTNYFVCNIYRDKVIIFLDDDYLRFACDIEEDGSLDISVGALFEEYEEWIMTDLDRALKQAYRMKCGD